MEELEEDCGNNIKERHAGVEDLKENCEEVICRSFYPEELNWSNASDLDYQVTIIQILIKNGLLSTS